MSDQKTFPWHLPPKDALKLSELLSVDVSTLVVKRTLATQAAPICGNCGRQIGLLDIAVDALETSKHGKDFLRVFFQRGNLEEVASKAALERVNTVEHKSVSCTDCGNEIVIKAYWFGMGVIWLDDDDDPTT